MHRCATRCVTDATHRRAGSRDPLAELSKLLRWRRTARRGSSSVGRFAVRLEGRRVDDALPGALGQLLFAFLVLKLVGESLLAQLFVGMFDEFRRFCSKPDFEQARLVDAGNDVRIGYQLK